MNRCVNSQVQALGSSLTDCLVLDDDQYEWANTLSERERCECLNAIEIEKLVHYSCKINEENKRVIYFF